MLSGMDKNNEKSPSDPSMAPLSNEDSERDAHGDEAFEVAGLAGSGTLDRLVDIAKEYARQATAENTNAAYKADWAHFSSWCRRRGADPMPPSPELLGLYITNCASPDNGVPALSVATIERRLSGLAWGITSSAALPLTARTATLPPCWPGSGANMHGPRCRKKRSSATTSSI